MGQVYGYKPRFSSCYASLPFFVTSSLLPLRYGHGAQRCHDLHRLDRNVLGVGQSIRYRVPWLGIFRTSGIHWLR